MRDRLIRTLALWIVPPLGYVIIYFLYLSNKKVWHISSPLPSTPVVIAFWHGELLMAPFIYFKLGGRQRAINVMISDHFDGEIIARIMRFFGMKTVRGSSRKGAAKVLINAIKAVKENGEDVGITPDGPRGPRHFLSGGTVAIAQKADIPIVIFNVRPQKFWQLGSWDKFVIPKPFGTIDLYASEPISVSGMEKKAADEMIRKRMLEYATL